MKRMTTDNPQLNIERLLNTARAENNQAVLHLGDEVVTLVEYVSKYAKETGCDVTQESVMDGDNCVECDCPVAILNILGIQAAENNARLKMIEKILGNDYDLDRLKELIEADREGRCVFTKCKIGDTVFVVGKKKIVKARVQEIYLDDIPELIYLVDFECDNCCDGCPFNSWCQSWEGEWQCDGEYGDGSIKDSNFGKTVFRTREAAEAALKESENDG